MEAQILPDIVPPGGADDGRLEMLGNRLVIGPECIRHRKIDADRLFGQHRIEMRDILRSTGTLDAAGRQDFLNHMAHLAITGNDDFHIKRKKRYAND